MMLKINCVLIFVISIRPIRQQYAFPPRIVTHFDFRKDFDRYIDGGGSGPDPMGGLSRREGRRISAADEEEAVKMTPAFDNCLSSVV